MPKTHIASVPGLETPSSRETVRPEIKAVAFDMFGVLLKAGTADTYMRHRERIAEQLGCSLEQVEAARSPSGEEFELGRIDFYRRTELMLEQLQPHLPASVRSQVSDERKKPRIIEQILDIERAEGKKLRQHSNVADTMHRLQARGIRTAICSNANETAVEFATRLGLVDPELFSAIVFSCYVKERKPHPGIYETVHRVLQVEPEACLFVDDNVWSLEGAMASGMQALCLRHEGEPPLPPGDYPFQIVNSMEEVPGFISS